MRKIPVLVLFFAGMASLALAGRAVLADKGSGLFAQAVQKYQAGDYSAAIDLNERVLKDAGVESAAVYFNLGNSYFKSGKLGKAVINYLRAERCMPRDGDIRANLAFARQAVEQYDSGNSFSLRSRWFGIFLSLSPGEFKWLALVAFMFTGLVFLWCLYAGLPSKRILLWTGLSLMACGYILAAFCVHLFDMQGRAVVLTKTEVRFEPSTEATVYFKLPEGAEIRILRYKEGWIKVQRSDGRLGWVLENTAESI